MEEQKVQKSTNHIVDILTNILGTITILTALYSVVFMAVPWLQAIFGIFAGESLFYIKSSNALNKIVETFKK